ncbi:MAG: sensor histidine kinase [Phycisphaerales bacterium]|nr:MAG: sensor histidine kinase [Phycisphaerales bacterium]
MRDSPSVYRAGGVTGQTPSGRDYRALQRRHVLRLLLTYLVPLIVLTGLFLTQYGMLLAERRRMHLRSIAENQSNTLDLFMRERVVNVTNLIRDPQLSVPPSPEEMHRYLSSLRLDSNSFIDVGFFDESGKQVAYAGPHPTLEDRDYAEQRWFQTLRARGEGFIITDIYLGFRGEPHFTIGVSRIVDGQHCVFRATLSPQKLYEYVSTLEGSDEVLAYTLNPAGQYQLVPPQVGQPLEVSPIIPPAKPDVGTESARFNGRRMDYAYSWLKTADWALIVRESQRQPAMLFSGPFGRTVIMSVIVALIVFCVILVRAGKLVAYQEETDQARAQLEHAAKLASVGELAGGIAHEINNPLAVITEEAGLLKDLIDPQFNQKVTMDEVGSHLDNIQQAAFRCRDITRKLLNFVRRTEVNEQEHDIHALINEVVDGMLGHELAVSNIEMVKEYSRDVSTVVTDQHQLQQVLVNLINNAVDAMEGRKGRITITTAREDDKLHLAVIDNGKGMTQAELNKIFMPFFTTKEVGKGTGLGLPVSYSIAKSLGGTILVQSVPAQGSSFTIVLPLGRPATHNGGANTWTAHSTPNA